MTEVLDEHFWRARITLARQRYVEWARTREPHGAPSEQWLQWRDWYFARCNYFNSERDKLYGKYRYSHRCQLNELYRARR